jgi:phospholipid/cholesterol/gamma-HCH transport system substrate-binding protein
MSPYRRNVMVGITVLGALVVLSWMIIQFGGRLALPFADKTIPVTFVADRADGVDDGSPITYRGVDSGHVTRVQLSADKQRVYFGGEIKAVPQIPGNVVARIRTSGFLGAGSVVSLETEGPPSTTMLKPGQTIEAKFVGLNELLPTGDFAELARELTLTVRRFRDTNLIEHLDEQVRHVGELITSLSNDQTRDDIKTTIANARALSDSARSIAAKLDKTADELPRLTQQARETMAVATTQFTRTGDNVEALSRQIGGRLTQVATLLDRFQSIAEKIDQGKGSAGAVINDNRLYESLVDTSRELNATIKDLKRLVEQWEQEGASLKLR